MVPGGRHGVAKGKEQLFTKLNVLLTGDGNKGEETLEIFGYITPDSYIMKKVANPQIESYKPKYPPHPVKTSIRLLLGWYSPPFRSPSIFTFNSTVLSVSSYKCFVKAVGLCILNLRDSLTVFPLSRT